MALTVELARRTHHDPAHVCKPKNLGNYSNLQRSDIGASQSRAAVSMQPKEDKRDWLGFWLPWAKLLLSGIQLGILKVEVIVVLWGPI